MSNANMDNLSKFFFYLIYLIFLWVCGWDANETIIAQCHFCY